MANIVLRDVTLEDIELLHEISVRTFIDTFSESNTEANMNAYLEQSLSREKLITELNDTNSQFYFATLEDNVIGYLKLNFGTSQTEVKEENALEVERIYVAKEFFGKSVGQLLYDKAIQVAKEQQKNYVWLGVWEENPRAISFYKKNGFVEFDRHIFKLGDDEQTDLMMKLEL